MIHSKRIPKKAVVAILISGKMKFKSKAVKKRKGKSNKQEGFYSEYGNNSYKHTQGMVETYDVYLKYDVKIANDVTLPHVAP